MKQINTLLLSSIIATLATGCVGTSSNLLTKMQSEKRIAIVVGNNEYANAKPLKTAANDADDMTASLSKLGFKVYHGNNLNCKDMLGMLEEVKNEVDKDTTVFVYFSGHGVGIQGMNIMLPSDFKDGGKCVSVGSNDYPGVPVDKFIFDLKLTDKDKKATNNDDKQKAKEVIVALDMCRSDGNESANKKTATNGNMQVAQITKGIAKGDISITSPFNPNKAAVDGIIVGYGTAEGNFSQDGDAYGLRNSLYTHHLLKHITNPSLPITEVFNKVATEVKKTSSGNQIPWATGSQVDVFLAKPAMLPSDVSAP